MQNHINLYRLKKIKKITGNLFLKIGPSKIKSQLYEY